MKKESIQDYSNVDLQKIKANKILNLAKEIENKKVGFKFVRIDDRTRVYKKV